MNNDEYAEDSDSSDEDYMPGASAGNGDVPSEVESDGDSEDPLSDVEETGKRTKTKRKNKKKPAKNGKAIANKLLEEADNKGDTQETDKSPVKHEEDKKKHADDLWASFKMDTGFKKKTATTPGMPNTNGTTNKEKAPESSPKTTEKKKEPETVKITQIFEFAGEQVKVEKEVKADSAEARLSVPNSTALPTASSSVAASPVGPKRKSGGLGGIGSVLSQINKKQKLSVLEKTKLDWNQYKQKEEIEDELESYKKGKDGYLEKQDFLQRADLRRFEIEKEVRAVERSKRINNS